MQNARCQIFFAGIAYINFATPDINQQTIDEVRRCGVRSVGLGHTRTAPEGLKTNSSLGI